MPIDQLQIVLNAKYHCMIYIVQLPSLCNFNFYLPIDALRDIVTNLQVTKNKTNIKFCFTIYY